MDMDTCLCYSCNHVFAMYKSGLNHSEMREFCFICEKWKKVRNHMLEGPKKRPKATANGG